MQAALLARGREVRPAKLLFYAKMAEKALQIYERDGWGEFPTVINPERREIRPTADRGPILLCVDTSGSMRGPREIVAKALALECMRAAREQERGCYVFAFSGPQEVSATLPSALPPIIASIALLVAARPLTTSIVVPLLLLMNFAAEGLADRVHFCRCKSWSSAQT